VRSTVARNKATPPAALAELARDPDNGVRWLVVRSALLEDLVGAPRQS
jgi:Leucine rich repeat variant